MLVNQKQLQMEIDTGATLSLISEKTFKTVGCQQELKPSNIKLHTYVKKALMFEASWKQQFATKD